MNVVYLRLRGSYVPSFKNKKRIVGNQLITSPKVQEWMKDAIDSFTSQLLSQCPTTENETVTAEKLRSWIASSVPVNDSCRYLIGCSWRFMKVPEGEQGALIRIEKIA